MNLQYPEQRTLWKKIQENVFFKDIEKDVKFYVNFKFSLIKCVGIKPDQKGKNEKLV